MDFEAVNGGVDAHREGEEVRGSESTLLVVIALMAGCEIGNDPTPPPDPVFLCEPAADDRCPSDTRCCSDDPAAVGGEWPDGPGVVALFSGTSGSRSVTGVCMGSPPQFTDVVDETGCVLPCDPTWERDVQHEVCGDDSVCCQTRELVEADCVYDEDEERWRPMDGRDALAAFEAGEERWGEGTHQDPGFEGCEAYAGGRDRPAFVECLERLTVANRRGTCRREEEAPPCLSPFNRDYTDPCEAMNR